MSTTANPLPTPATVSAQLTGGFWGNLSQAVRDVTIPRMWENLSDPQVSAGWQNFLIADGQQDGIHLGPPFLDGDLYKWLEAAITSLETQNRNGEDTSKLAATIETIAQMIARVQREDGYIHTATFIAARNGENAQELEDRFNFETYNLGHLMTAGVRHHRVTGSRTLLDAGIKAADYLIALAQRDPLHLAESAICPSHYMGTIDIYRATGEEKYLTLAKRFVEVRDDFAGGDDNQDRIPVREQPVAVGHAVRANYLYAGLADIAAESNDSQLAEVVDRVWQDVVDTKLYITGGCGALYDGASPDAFPWQGEISRVHQAYGRAFQLPNTTAHNESCANIGMILWSKRLHQITGEARYFDVIEQIAYNSLLSSMGTDADSFTYTNPLRQVRELPFPLRMPGDTALDPVPPPPPSDQRMRTSYMSCFCCPPNIARTLAQFHEYIFSRSTDTGGKKSLWVNLFADADSALAHTASPSSQLQVSMTTTMPWEGSATITVTAVPEGGNSSTLRIRIPDWMNAKDVAASQIRVNGEVTAGGDHEALEPSTYHVIDREWKVGDVVEINIAMHTHLVRGHRLAEEITNQVALRRGPVVYCLESVDLPADVKLEQVALRRNTSPQRGENLELSGAKTTGELPTLTTAAVVLPEVGGSKLYSELDADSAENELQEIQATFIPYFAWGNRGHSEMSVWVPLVW